MHFAIPYLKETKGKIVAITSSAGYLPAARISFYNVYWFCYDWSVSFFFYAKLIFIDVNIGVALGK